MHCAGSRQASEARALVGSRGLVFSGRRSGAVRHILAKPAARSSRAGLQPGLPSRSRIAPSDSDPIWRRARHFDRTRSPPLSRGGKACPPRPSQAWRGAFLLDERAMVDDRDPGPQVDEDRLATYDQLREAWAAVEDHYDGFRAAIAALARFDREKVGDVVELRDRMGSCGKALREGVATVEELALRLASAAIGTRRIETLMISTGLEIKESLKAVGLLEADVRGLEDLELRRLVTALVECVETTRQAYEELARYAKAIYGEA